MRSRTAFLMLVMLVMMAAGCKPPANAVPVSATKPATPAPAVQASTPEIAESFRKGMPYAVLRKQLLAAGWLPLLAHQCRANADVEALVCRHLLEAEICSSDGRCVMGFADREDHRLAKIGTSGPYENWDVSGKEATLKVQTWDFAPLDALLSPNATCPSQDFDVFLKAFASDNQVKRAFTAPLVKVAELDAGGYGEESFYVPAADYRDFHVAYGNGTFHFVDYRGVVEPSPLHLTVKQESKQKRLVSYPLNMSEGNSYRFENKGDCWYLTEDPEPPTP